MPTLQVINREEDPTVKQIGQLGNDVADSILKSQTLQATRHLYDIQAKNSENDTQKVQLEQKKQYLDLMDRAQKIRDPQVREAVVSAGLKVLHAGHGGKGMDIMSSVGEDLSNTMKSIQPSKDEATEGELAGAQAGNFKAEAALKNAQVGLINGISSGGAPGSTPGASNGYIPGDINIGGMTLLNPGSEQAKARATALGGAQGKQEVDFKPIVQGVDAYVSTLDKALKEVGGESSTAFGAGSRAVMGRATAGFKPNSAVTALDAQKKPVSLQIAAYINGGRPTEQDAKTAEQILPDISYPKATNDILRKRLRTMFNTQSGSPEAKALLQQSSSIASVDQRFADALRKQGKDDSYINKTLSEIHKQRGY